MSSQEVVLVTGANTGLGFQIIRALLSSEKAYRIILGGRLLAKAQEAVNAVVREFPSSHSKLCPLQVDIEDDGSIQEAFEKVQFEFGRVDVLINNAGIIFIPSNLPTITEVLQASSSTKNLPQATRQCARCGTSHGMLMSLAQTS
jgi:NAD(P)-dependent dehydrogenase (short-subunit alcohol dehydrogenase family)